MKLFCTASFCFVSALFTKVFAQVEVQDSLALIDLYNSTNNVGWYNHANWLTAAPVTTWYGITVSEARVTKINLRSNGMTGVIPASLGNLANLQVLDLGGNSISGSIPASLGKLVNLQTLSIDNASLSGSIPASLGKLINLQVLNLFNNQLSGIIPPSLGKLVNLRKLYLNRNQLTGPIPPTLGNLIYLNVLYLDTNQLTGSIPSSLGNLLNLIQIVLNNNQLTGTIPSSFGDLSNLQDLYLYSNQLAGTIPPSLGNLQKLKAFQLGHNQLSGTIPASLGNLTSLILLNFSYNQLKGTIPSSFTNLLKLQELIINDNQLSGVLPDYTGSISNLTHLFLSNNQFSGSIPSSLGNLKQLLFLAMDNNYLSGNLPDELANLTSLYYLDLSHNLLNDTIPASLSNLKNLQLLFIQNNYFTFNGMEQLVQALGSISTLSYSPQRSIKLHNNDNTLSVSAGGTLANNKFYWYKGDQLIKTVAGDSTFTITEPGTYHVEITNSIATDLSLRSDTMEISVLPVNLIAFTATKQQTTVALNWKTTNEINNSHFEIERSVDSKIFYSIGTVKGLNSTNMNNYFFIDNTPLNGINYYRLKQVDKDGRFNYSGIASVEFIPEISTFALSPNPADNSIKISIPAGNTASQIIIYDLTGRKVINEEIAANVTSKQINISRLAAGSYYIILKQNGRQKTLKLIKK